MSIVHSIVSSVGVGNGVSLTVDAWDVVIGDIPFMLDPSPNAPFRIKSIGQTLYRYDTSNQAGEQTLGAWWLRSQTSFHGGCGQTYFDGTDPTISTDVASLRFQSSVGVDVWTPGAATLLNDTKRVFTATASGGQLMSALDGTTPVLFYSDGAHLYRWDGTTQTEVTWGGSGTILSLAQDGVHYYAADATGIYKGTLSGGAGSLLWNTGESDVIIRWIKQRLMVAKGGSIYEATGTGYTTGPTNLSVTSQGGSDNLAQYTYVVDLIVDTGGAPSPQATIPGNSTLDGTHYNALSWDAPTEAGDYTYAIYRGVGALNPTWTLVETITRTQTTPRIAQFTYNDTGAAGSPKGAPPSNTSGNLPAAKYTSPEPSWRWDAMADGPEAIYTAGHVGSEAIIYKFVLDSNGGIPTLTTGISAVALPIGESVTALQNHTDTWLAIGTTSGVRIAQFASGGDLSMSLLTNDIGGTCNALGARDRFIYANMVTADGVGTLARLDLTFAIKDGLFALASDLRANDRVGNVDSFQSGDVTGIVTMGDAMAFLVDGNGIFLEDTANVVRQGTLTTSRVRYDTSEAKIFDSVRWHGGAPGTIECDVSINTDVNGRNVGQLSPATGFDSFDRPILESGGQFATLTFVLKPDVGAPTLGGWLLKALPMQSRSYQIMLPLSCYDRETLGNGKPFGHEGWSLERLDAIMEMADEQKSQVLQQIAGPKSQRRNMRVVIDDIDYQQVDPPGLSTRTGGLLYLTLRTV